MVKPELACILPVSGDPTSFIASLESVLSLDHVKTEVLVVTNSLNELGASIAPYLDDARVTVMEQPIDANAMTARAIGVERSRADWIVFLDKGCTLASDSFSLVRAVADEYEAELVMQSSTDTAEIQIVDSPAIASHVFDGTSQTTTLSGAFMTREVATRAVAQLPETVVNRDSDLLMLFSTCLSARRLVVIPESLYSEPEPETLAHQMNANEFERLCESAQAAVATARLLSQQDVWSVAADAYEGLFQTALGKVMAKFPYDVAKPDRPAAFDALVASWPNPELVSAIMHWRGDALLPLLESIQSARSLATGGKSLQRVAILVPQHANVAPEILAGLEEALRALGVIPKLFTDECAPYTGIFNTCIEIPAYGDGSSYLARARALNSAFAEQDIDAVVSPLSSDPAQAPDFLLARLSGIPVAVFAPEHPLRQIPGATMPGLMKQVQMANVISVPIEKNATFWSMASHARIVVEAEAPDADEFVSRMLDALELPESAPRKTYRPSVSFGPLGLLPKKQTCEQDDALAQVEEMKRQMELLQARLAGAESEAESLRKQLAESKRFDNQTDA